MGIPLLLSENDRLDLRICAIASLQLLEYFSEQKEFI